MIANTDKQVKMEQMVAIMSQIKNTILFVAQDISPYEKRKENTVRKKENASKKAVRNAKNAAKKAARKDAEETNEEKEDKTKDYVETKEEETKEEKEAIQIYNEEVKRIDKDKRIKLSKTKEKKARRS